MKKDKLIPYKILVNFLSETLGPDYEIVLHDLTSEQNCICAIENGHITNRKIGDPLTDISLNFLSNKDYKNKDYIANYKGSTTDNRVLRSSTMIIKDDQDCPIALLCINFDDSRFIDIHDTLLSIAHPLSFLKEHSTHTLQHEEMYGSSHPSTTGISEKLTSDINMLMKTIYEQAVTPLSLPENRLNQEERLELIKALKGQNFFKLKGSVSFAAHKLGCSTASIYRYLNEVK